MDEMDEDRERRIRDRIEEREKAYRPILESIN